MSENSGVFRLDFFSLSFMCVRVHVVREHLGFLPARGMQFVFSSSTSHLETIPGNLLSPSLPNYIFFFLKYRQDTIINIAEEGRQERRYIEKHR